MPKFPITRLFVIITFSGLICGMKCSKDDVAFKIEGYDIVSYTGQMMKHIGPADQDWTFSHSLSESEKAYLKFETPFTLDNTKEATISARFFVTPNPCNTVQQYYYTASDSVLVRLAIVNNKGEVLYRTGAKVKGNNLFNVDVSDRSKFRNGQGYRVFYSFSALNKPDFRSGYGDMMICENVSDATLADFTRCK